jgi:hypothetical protein
LWVFRINFWIEIYQVRQSQWLAGKRGTGEQLSCVCYHSQGHNVPSWSLPIGSLPRWSLQNLRSPRLTSRKGEWWIKVRYKGAAAQSLFVRVWQSVELPVRQGAFLCGHVSLAFCEQMDPDQQEEEAAIWSKLSSTAMTKAVLWKETSTKLTVCWALLITGERVCIMSFLCRPVEWKCAQQLSPRAPGRKNSAEMKQMSTKAFLNKNGFLSSYVSLIVY